MTFGEAINHGTTKLQRHSCSPHATREAEELLSFSAKTTREELLMRPEKKLPSRALRSYVHALRRRLRHEPIEYVIGQADFLGKKFRVTKDTLIPRPATEALVEAVLTSCALCSAPFTLYDIGTGSGAIAISVARTLPDAKVIATDTSAKALKIARANAKTHGVEKRIRFMKTDLLPAPSALRPQITIIANLPYIPTSEMKRLPPDIRKHEPRQALEGGKDGLKYYRRLLAKPLHLYTSGPLELFFEILPEQYTPLERLAKKTWPDCRTKKIRNPSDVIIGVHIQRK